MGGGTWAADIGPASYSSVRAERLARAGTAFEYTEDVRRGRAPRAVHARMNPRGVTRESRDSAAHPASLAVMVFFDVTGSMGHVPVELEQRLPRLMGLLLERGYAADPQVLFGAIGDGRCDAAPLQVGQFESDAQMDEDLGRILLEGGGGDRPESYGLAHYFAARHTSTDCWEKRRQKGYLFTIGDVDPHSEVAAGEIRGTTGDGAQEALSMRQVVEEARERFHVFHLLVGNIAAEAEPAWRALLGDSAVVLGRDVRYVAETIAAIVGLTEGTVTAEAVREHLREMGVELATVEAIMRAATPAAEAARAIRLREEAPAR
jgi:hypothetical protein